MEFQWTISAGLVLHLLGTVITVLTAWIALNRRLGDIETKMLLLWRSWTGGDEGRSMDARMEIVEHDMLALRCPQCNVLHRPLCPVRSPA